MNLNWFRILSHQPLTPSPKIKISDHFGMRKIAITLLEISTERVRLEIHFEQPLKRPTPRIARQFFPLLWVESPTKKTSSDVPTWNSSFNYLTTFEKSWYPLKICSLETKNVWAKSLLHLSKSLQIGPFPPPGPNFWKVGWLGALSSSWGKGRKRGLNLSSSSASQFERPRVVPFLIFVHECVGNFQK